MHLSGRQRKELLEALIDAFPNKSSLEQMLALELNKNLEAIAGGDSLEEVIFNLIRVAEAQGWLEDLIRSAFRSNHGNQKLLALAKQIPIESNQASFRQSDKSILRSYLFVSNPNSLVILILSIITFFFISCFLHGLSYGTSFYLLLKLLLYSLLLALSFSFSLRIGRLLYHLLQNSELIVRTYHKPQEQIHNISNKFEIIKFKNLLITSRYLLALALGGSLLGELVASSSGSIFGATGGAIYGLISLNINNPNIWKQGQNVIASALGGAFLGGMIGQIPGSILGAIIGATFKIFTQI